MGKELTDSDVLALGGWTGSDAAVLGLAIHGRVAAALVDTNGDGQETEVSSLLFRNTHWQEIGASGCGSFDEKLNGSGGNGPVVYAYGVERKDDFIRVTFLGTTHDVPVNRKGVWLFVADYEGEALLRFVDKRPVSNLPRRV